MTHRQMQYQRRKERGNRVRKVSISARRLRRYEMAEETAMVELWAEELERKGVTVQWE